MQEAVELLARAKENGGGLELHDLFGPAAESLANVEEIIHAIQSHDALQWCLKEPAMLEPQRDDTLVPPVWFVLTGAGEGFVDMWGSPAEILPA